MILNSVLGSLALLSLVLLAWQWWVGRMFPLHQRAVAHSFPPAVTLLKPLKGCEPSTEDCLRSWFKQDYTGRVQILFSVASADDPVCAVVRKLRQEFPGCDSELVVFSDTLGPNAKVSKLVELERRAKHEILIISDADVCIPPDLLANVVEPLRVGGADSKEAIDRRRPSTNSECGLVCCFYSLANPTTLAMRWESVAINADFWSQVLQSRSLRPLDFALGAVMATRRRQLDEIGGFAALVDCLADDYLLGNRIARRGYGIALSTVVVECWSSPMNWSAVWKHQLRWARTIRVCQPVPYFFSALSNATLWPLLWLLARPSQPVLGLCLFIWVVRVLVTLDLQQRLTRRRERLADGWLALFKDLAQALIWLCAFAGNTIEWRGQRMKLRRDGSLVKG